MEVGVTIRLELIENQGDHLEVRYADEADIDYDAGVVFARMARIRHDVIPQELVDELLDVTVRILDAARVQRHRVADKYSAPR
jgi:hypothetical protein